MVDENNQYYILMIEETKKIIQRSNNMKWLKPKPDIADPYVIALAFVFKTSSMQGYTIDDVIVVQDNTKEMNNVCKSFKINTCRTVDLIKYEEWQF